MQINSISSHNFKYRFSKLKDIKQNEEIVTEKETKLPNYKNYSDINFMSKKLVLRSPVARDLETQKLIIKIRDYFEKLPKGANLKTPAKLICGKDIVGFTMDKTMSEDRTKIVVKLKRNSDNIEDWNDTKEFNEFANIVLNKKGQMVDGSCTVLKNALRACFFLRDEKNVRSINFDDRFYRPISNDSTMWINYKIVTKTLNLDNLVTKDRFTLFAFFNELTKLDTAII